MKFSSSQALKKNYLIFQQKAQKFDGCRRTDGTYAREKLPEDITLLVYQAVLQQFRLDFMS